MTKRSRQAAKILRGASLLVMLATGLWGQQGQPMPPHDGQPGDFQQGGPPPLPGGRGGRPGQLMRGLHAGPPGRWWNDPAMAKELDLTADQQKRMDSVFLQNRLKLIDLTASLQKEELTLEPLLSADRPDSTRVFAQIDRVAQTRADLEKANGRMLFELRQVLTVDQWRRLQTRTPPPPRGQ